MPFEFCMVNCWTFLESPFLVSKVPKYLELTDGLDLVEVDIALIQLLNLNGEYINCHASQLTVCTK